MNSRSMFDDEMDTLPEGLRPSGLPRPAVSGGPSPEQRLRTAQKPVCMGLRYGA